MALGVPSPSQQRSHCTRERKKNELNLGSAFLVRDPQKLTPVTLSPGTLGLPGWQSCPCLPNPLKRMVQRLGMFVAQLIRMLA